MIIESDASGTEFLRARIEEAKLLLPGLLVDSAQLAGDGVASALGDAAPHGKGSGDSPPGDAPGALSESFHCETEAQGDGAMATVSTTQPAKLRYVVEGRGWVYPVNKRALYWDGLPHPVPYAKPSQANDFISPVINDQVNEIVEPEVNAIIDNLSAILEGV